METNDIRDVRSVREKEGRLGAYDREKTEREGGPSERAKRGRNKEKEIEIEREREKKKEK